MLDKTRPSKVSVFCLDDLILMVLEQFTLSNGRQNNPWWYQGGAHISIDDLGQVFPLHTTLTLNWNNF